MLPGARPRIPLPRATRRTVIDSPTEEAVDFDALFSAPPPSPLAHVRPAGGAPLPRLDPAGRVDDQAPVVSEDGLDWFMDADAGGAWCSGCGGPCECLEPVTALRIVLAALGGAMLGVLLGLVVAAVYILLDSGGDMRWLGELRKVL